MSTRELSNRVDVMLYKLSEKYGLILLKSSIGLIYIWFGVLKFFNGYSPAEKLASDTLEVITFHLIDKYHLLWALATWEIAIGVLFLFRVKSKLLAYVALTWNTLSNIPIPGVGIHATSIRV